MDMLIPVAMIAFLAQVIIWLGLPDSSAVDQAPVSATRPKAVAA